MIVLTTDTLAHANPHAHVVFKNLSALPAAPALHRLRLRVSVTGLTYLGAPSIFYVQCYRQAEPYNTYADFEVTLTHGNDPTFPVDFDIGPIDVDAASGITVYFRSNNVDDTDISFTIYALSEDMEYYLAGRAADASPVANSPIARLKASSDTVAKVESALTVKT